MKTPRRYPVPFWTLTPKRLWGIAAVVGLFTASIAWMKVKQCDNLQIACFICLMTAVAFIMQVHQIWKLVLGMDHYPADFEKIPESAIWDVPAPRWRYALLRFPLALVTSLIPYLLIAWFWHMYTSF